MNVGTAHPPSAVAVAAVLVGVGSGLARTVLALARTVLALARTVPALARTVLVVVTAVADRTVIKLALTAEKTLQLENAANICVQCAAEILTAHIMPDANIKTPSFLCIGTRVLLVLYRIFPSHLLKNSHCRMPNPLSRCVL